MRRNAPDINRNLPGFTFIESLVVLAIIAMPAALLLSAARERAQAIRCPGNFHPIGLALAPYVDNCIDEWSANHYHPFPPPFTTRPILLGAAGDVQTGHDNL